MKSRETRKAANGATEHANGILAFRADPRKERMLAARFDSETYREFKILAASNTMGTDDLLAFALSLVFEKYGRPLTSGLRNKLAKLNNESS